MAVPSITPNTINRINNLRKYNKIYKPNFEFDFNISNVSDESLEMSYNLINLNEDNSNSLADKKL